MQALREYRERYGVRIEQRWLASDCHMTIGGRLGTIISYDGKLMAHQVLLAVTTMIEVLELVRVERWVGQRFRFVYPLPADCYQVSAAKRRSRRDYRIPERLARRRLLPDAVLERAEREEWEAWQLVEYSGLDAETCRIRVDEWRLERARFVRALDGPIPF